MTQEFHYFSPATPGNDAWDVNLGQDAVRLGEMPGLVHCFERGLVGTGAIQIDDPDGDVGHEGDAILGLKQFYVEELDCDYGDTRTFTGYILDRTYSRGRFVTGAGRLIDATLLDENAMLSFRVFQPEAYDATSSFNRPAETDTERIAALLEVDFLSTTLFDDGYIIGADVDMDAHDYTGQRPVDVLEDCAEQSGCNFAVRYEEGAGLDHLTLHYHSNDADIDPASAAFSNLPSDLSDPTVLLVNDDWQLRRDPSRLIAGVLEPYRGGTVYEQNIATSYIYGYRDAYYPAPTISSSAQAIIRAQRYLTEGSTEDDRLVGTVDVPSGRVNDVKAGQYVSVRFTHLPGYEDWRDCRVLRREIAQTKPTTDRYTVRLELTPMACSPDVLQSKSTGIMVGLPSPSITIALDTAPTPGNRMVAALYVINNTFSVTPLWPAGWTQEHYWASSAGGYDNQEIWVYSKVVEVGDTGVQVCAAVGCEGSDLGNSLVLDVIEVSCSQVIVQAVDAGTSIGPTIDVPAITTSTEALLLGFHSRVTSAVPRDLPAGWTLLHRDWEDLGDRPLVATFSRIVNAGTLAAATFMGGSEGGNTAGFVIVELPRS